MSLIRNEVCFVGAGLICLFAGMQASHHLLIILLLFIGLITFELTAQLLIHFFLDLIEIQFDFR